MSDHGLVRGTARRLRRLLLPSLDLLLLQRRRLLRFVEPAATVLDAGCGDGTLAFLLLRRGCRVVGASNDAQAIARLRERRARQGLATDEIDFRVHDLARDGPVDGAFDAALCFDVLEHIADDRAALAAVAGSLRQGGRLLLTVPDRSAPPLWGDAVSPTEDGGHVRQGYTREELEAMLDDAGMRPVRWQGFAGFFTQKATSVARRLERRQGVAFVALRVLWLTLMRPLCWLDPLLPWPPYQLFVLAQKP